ncbi:hypothetical protein COCON_G00118830, partial [Conger conger]
AASTHPGYFALCGTWIYRQLEPTPHKQGTSASKGPSHGPPLRGRSRFYRFSLSQSLPSPSPVPSRLSVSLLKCPRRAAITQPVHWSMPGHPCTPCSC